MTRRDQAPAAAPARRAAFPPVVRQAVGPIDVWIVRQAASPVVSIALLTAAGAAREPEPLAGLASLCAMVLDEGTATLDSSTIARRIEGLGGSLGTGAGWDAASLNAELLASDLAAGLELITEVALEAAFPDPEVERLRAQRLAEIQRRVDRPGAVAEEALLRAIYGDSPYGRFIGGHAVSVADITRDDLVRFHRREWLESARRPALLVVGDLSPAALLAEVERLSRRWPRAATRPEPPTGRPRRAGRRVVLVDRPDAAQTELRVGHAGPPRTDPDFSTLQVLMTALGGKFTSRLNLNLRERQGITYGAAARWSERTGAGPIVLSAAVANDAAGLAAREMLHEVERLRESEIAAQELAETRDYLLGVFPYTVQTTADVLRHLEDLVIFGLEPDEIGRHLDRIAAVTPQNLQGAARRHLHPDDATIVAVGPRDLLRGQFPRDELAEEAPPT